MSRQEPQAELAGFSSLELPSFKKCTFAVLDSHDSQQTITPSKPLDTKSSTTSPDCVLLPFGFCQYTSPHTATTSACNTITSASNNSVSIIYATSRRGDYELWLKSPLHSLRLPVHRTTRMSLPQTRLEQSSMMLTISTSNILYSISGVYG